MSEHCIINRNNKKIIIKAEPIETMLNFEFYRITDDTKEECTHIVADYFSKFNPVHIIAGISYADDYVYYSAIVKRSMEDNLGFYVYSKESKRILLVYLLLDLYNYQTKPFESDFLEKVTKSSGLYKLRGLINKLDSKNQVKCDKFGTNLFAWCVGQNKQYLPLGMLAIGDHLVFSHLLKNTKYESAIGEAIDITLELAYLSKGKLIGDIYYDEYVHSDGTKPFSLVEKVANVMGLNGTRRISCFLIDLENMRKQLISPFIKKDTNKTLNKGEDQKESKDGKENQSNLKPKF